MGKNKKRGPWQGPGPPTEEGKKAYDALTEEDQKSYDRYRFLLDPKTNLKAIFYLQYADKLKKADWSYSTTYGKRRRRAELNRQAGILYDRLLELEDDKSSDAKCERAVLKWRARYSFCVYEALSSPTPGVPLKLMAILNQEYPGGPAVHKLAANKERKTSAKAVAIAIVKKHPNLSQGELAHAVEVTDFTIRGWAPDLLAAGWKGAKFKKKAAKPKTPKRGKPWKPGDPVPQSSKDD